MYNREQIDNVHPDYAANIANWRLYSDSYNGGAQYRNGEYLMKYQLETASEYYTRLEETPLENHCRRVIDSYTSFIYGATIEREYGSIENNPNLVPFLEDADMEGRSFSQFMREASKFAGIYGSVYIFVDKPQSNARTRAEELGQGIRPYLSMVSPENVLDWRVRKNYNGSVEYVYLKVLHDKTENDYIYRIYTPEETTIVRAGKNSKEDMEILEVIPNALGSIPVVVLYNNRTWKHGIGVSDICDISGLQRSIYGDYSEITQLIKLSNHPTLVRTASTEISAGAGAVITVPEDIAMQPYLLTPSGQNISTLLDTINRKVEAIEKMSHLESISGQRSARSGIALMVEQKALASLLSDKASGIQLAEEQIWRLWCRWENTAWDGQILYPDSFDTRDRQQDLMNLKLAQEIGVTDSKLKQYMEMSIASAIVDDDSALQEINESIMKNELVHPVTTAENREEHIKTMIMEGLTDKQILEMHSEITQADIDYAKQELLDSNNE